jgi:hypothetical protein
MPCRIIETPIGVIIACSRGKAGPKVCAFCRKPAARLCDFPTEGGGTCSKPLCWSCTRQEKRNGKVRDYCPDHPKE